MALSPDSPARETAHRRLRIPQCGLRIELSHEFREALRESASKESPVGGRQTWTLVADSGSENPVLVGGRAKSRVSRLRRRVWPGSTTCPRQDLRWYASLVVLSALRPDLSPGSADAGSTMAREIGRETIFVAAPTPARTNQSSRGEAAALGGSASTPRQARDRLRLCRGKLGHLLVGSSRLGRASSWCRFAAGWSILAWLGAATLVSCGGEPVRRGKAPSKAAAHVDDGIARIREACERGDYDEVAALARSGLAVSPDNPWLHYFHGLAKHGRGDYRGALQDLTTCIRLDPGNADALCYRATVVMLAAVAPPEEDQSRAHMAAVRESSIRDLRAALAIDPNHVDANLGLGFRSQRSDVPGAIKHFTRVIEIDPTDPRPYYHLGGIEEQRGDDASALRHYTAAIARGGVDDCYYSARATVREKTGDLQGALEDSSAAIERAPEEGLYYRKRARVRERLGDIRGAEDDARVADRLAKEWLESRRKYAK